MADCGTAALGAPSRAEHGEVGRRHGAARSSEPSSCSQSLYYRIYTASYSQPSNIIAHEKGFKFHAQPQTGAFSCFALCMALNGNDQTKFDGHHLNLSKSP